MIKENSNNWLGVYFFKLIYGEHQKRECTKIVSTFESCHLLQWRKWRINITGLYMILSCVGRVVKRKEALWLVFSTWLCISSYLSRKRMMLALGMNQCSFSCFIIIINIIQLTRTIHPGKRSISCMHKFL